MPDYTEILREIATTLGAISMAPNYAWFTPIAIILSGGIGWWASQRTIRRQERRWKQEQAARKRLVFHLLHDEITLRWKGEIEPYLRGLTQKAPLDALQGFSTMELRGDDVFTFKSVSESFSEYYFLGDNRLVSQIVHGYLLVCDLVDFHRLVIRLMQERNQAYVTVRQALSDENAARERIDAEFGERIRRAFERLPQKLAEIDQRFSEILPQITT